MSAGLRLRRVTWAFVLCFGPQMQCGFPVHDIYDVQADIRDLDVGDLDDMESDVPPTFLDNLQRRRLKAPSLANMENPADWALSASSGMQMSFVYLTQAKCEELGKSGSDTLGKQWRSLMETGGLNANLYVTDPGKFLIVSNKPGALALVKQFALSQPDVDWFEHNQQRSYPDGRSAPLMDHEARKEREIELGWRKPTPPKKETAKKALASKEKAKGSAKKATGMTSVEVKPGGQTAQLHSADAKKPNRKRRRKARKAK